MTIIIKNKTNRMLNLGKAGGSMLSFAPKQTREMSEEQFKAHEATVMRYMEGDFLDVVTKAKKPRVADSAEPQESFAPKKKAAKKATRKKVRAAVHKIVKE